jgi:hypothetical protein
MESGHRCVLRRNDRCRRGLRVEPRHRLRRRRRDADPRQSLAR